MPEIFDVSSHERKNFSSVLDVYVLFVFHHNAQENLLASVVEDIIPQPYVGSKFAERSEDVQINNGVRLTSERGENHGRIDMHDSMERRRWEVQNIQTTVASLLY